MSSRAITIIVVIILIILGIWLWTANRDGTLPETGTTTVSTTTTNTGTTTATTTAGQNVVTYSDSGYAPASLRVSRGTTVTFRNNSSRSMWPASAMHPTHAVYPTTGGCIGSTFDACSPVASGGSWSFKFDAAGTWRYHDHLNVSRTGTIIVE